MSRGPQNELDFLIRAIYVALIAYVSLAFTVIVLSATDDPHPKDIGCITMSAADRKVVVCDVHTEQDLQRAIDGFIHSK